MFFQLTDDHIRTGRLTEDDYSSVAGYKAHLLSFDDFPHAEELRQKGKLDVEKGYERDQAVFDRLAGLGVIHPEREGCMKVASYISRARRKLVQHDKALFRYASPYDYFTHFRTILDVGDYAKAHEMEKSPLWKRSQSSPSLGRVIPGLLSEPVSVDGVYKNMASVVWQSDEDGSEIFWTRRTGIGSSLLETQPSIPFANLIGHLHELRHFQQLNLKSSHPEIATHYSELDADLAARTCLRKKLGDHESLKTDLDCRYLDMMTACPTHWIASGIDAIEKGERPCDFYKTFQSVRELHVRIAAGLEGKNMDSVSSDALQESLAVWAGHPNSGLKPVVPSDEIEKKVSFYKLKLGQSLRRDPSALYTHLRQIKERGVITDPFANELAGKILSAAYSFSPKVIYADQERPSFKGADRVYGLSLG